MSSTENIKSTVDGLFFVDIEAPSQEAIDSYYDSSGDIKSSSDKNGPRVFKKATILHTWNEKKFPIGSVWMMGESPGMTINFFGKKFTAIQEKDLYARID